MPIKVPLCVIDCEIKYENIYTKEEYEKIEWMLANIIKEMYETKIDSMYHNFNFFDAISSETYIDKEIKEWYESYKNREKK